MKKILTIFFLISIFVTSTITPSYAVLENYVDKEVFVATDAKLKEGAAPNLFIEDRHGDFTGGEEKFILKLKNAEWLKDKDFKDTSFEKEMSKFINKLKVKRLDDETVECSVYGIKKGGQIKIPLISKPINNEDLKVETKGCNCQVNKKIIRYAQVHEPYIDVCKYFPTYSKSHPGDKIISSFDNYRLNRIAFITDVHGSFPEGKSTINLKVNKGFVWKYYGKVKFNGIDGVTYDVVRKDENLILNADFSKAYYRNNYASYSMEWKDLKIRATDEAENNKDVHVNLTGDYIKDTDFIIGKYVANDSKYTFIGNTRVKRREDKIEIHINKIQLETKDKIIDLLNEKDDYKWYILNKKNIDNMSLDEVRKKALKEKTFYKIDYNNNINIGKNLKSGRYFLVNPQIIEKYNVLGIEFILDDDLQTKNKIQDNLKEKAEEEYVEKEKKIEKKIKFNDMKNHWAQKEVESLVSDGIISGFDNNTFRPEDPLTRAQIAVLLVKALKLDALSNENYKVFDDVNKNNWCEKYVYLVHKEKLMNGVGNNKFNPKNKVTGEQLLQIVINVYEKYKGKIAITEEDIKDVGDSSLWAKEAIAKAKKIGITDKLLDELDYKGNAKRSQAAVVIFELIES
ncbi:S-layer homology domain-containing protein [Crassaminicella profunda]|uniref:S-layer homology domain-containing protein n=1 Tax=Crassaminicella profunda TaxID=1286698 RepID=UPI001CA68E39|nr:S-layer homology domain-containing protein [Crassaminicella profunda]QZY53787.1 S-layer homology domain-containing protein [Crassaminicella profunda]